MKYTTRIILLFLLLAGLKSPLAGQTYPIQVNTVLMPPASPYLSHYYNAMVPKLQVHINFVDFNKPITQARLRIRISSNNLQIQSKPRALTSILELMPGSPLMLQGMDLMEYFDIRNLDLPVFIAQTGKLPAGMYRFCFWLEDLHTNRPISNPNLGCSYAYIALGKPPLLNLPKNNEQVAFREPVNLFFQWTPQHLSMAGAMMFTEYEFILKELWDKERSPEAGFASTPEFYSETVKVPFLYYGAAHPLLMPGKRYAWAVRAKLAPGYEDAAEFVNKGFSEIRSFVFQPDCKVPSSCKTQILNDKEVLFRWQGAGFDKRYKVEYAENGISNGYSKEVEGEETVTLRGFKKGRSYQYRVGEFCMQSMDYVFSNPHSFEIPKDIKKREFNCGLLPPDLNITNRKAITELLENDEITAAGFPISLTRVSGQKKFSGEGYVSIPMLGYANVKVRFSNIQVNTDYQLIDGFIETTYDPEGKQVVSTDTLQQALAELKDQLELIIKEIEFVIGGTENIQVTENPEALTDSMASKFIIEVEGIDGEKTQVAVDSLPLVLEDAEGNQYEIDKDLSIRAISAIDPRELTQAYQCKFNIHNKIYPTHSLYTIMIDKEGKHTLDIEFLAEPPIGIPNEKKDQPEKTPAVNDEKQAEDSKKDSYQTLEEFTHGGKSVIKWKYRKIEKTNPKKEKEYTSLSCNQLSCSLPYHTPGNYELLVCRNDSVFGQLMFQVYEKPVVTFHKPENYTGTFGFDDGMELKNAKDDYSKITIKGAEYTIPWLGVLPEQNERVTLFIKIPEPASKNWDHYPNSKVFITSNIPDKIQINTLETYDFNLKDARNPLLVQITSKELLSDQPELLFTGQYYLYAYIINDKTGEKETIGKMHIICKEPTIRYITFVHVQNDENDAIRSDIDPYKLIKYINTHSHNQLFITYSLVESNVNTINGKGIIPKKAGTMKWTNKKRDDLIDELNTELDKALKKANSTKESNVLVFYITQIPFGAEFAFADMNGLNGCMGQKPKDYSDLNMYNAISHELGHSVGLPHPFCCHEKGEDDNICFKILNCNSANTRYLPLRSSNSNMMDYGDINRKNSYFYYQWKAVYSTK